MNMNQSEFSKRLDVSFATVNRWENGHATGQTGTGKAICFVR